MSNERLPDIHPQPRIQPFNTWSNPVIAIVDVVGHEIRVLLRHAVGAVGLRGSLVVVLRDPADGVRVVKVYILEVEEVGFEEVGEEGVAAGIAGVDGVAAVAFCCGEGSEGEK